ncbi:hypothetical protein FRC11_000931 [Ceratobasidium sp. 423]|nr:hypothetical protein FRC11_000931 [Ceratobasidium sp. 423]
MTGQADQDIPSVLQLCIPPRLMQMMNASKGWHIVLPINMHAYVSTRGNHIKLQQVVETDPRIKTIVFPSRAEDGFSCASFTTIASPAIQRFLSTGRSPIEAWLNTWIMSEGIPKLYDLIVLAGGADNKTFLYAPFETRPFGKNLPPVEEHRRDSVCRPPYGPSEDRSEFFRQPRWVLCKIPLNRKGDDIWKNKVEGSRLRVFKASLTEVHVCCSFCGKGSKVGLPPGAKLMNLSREFVVEIPWPAVP